jgi:hypothetical protein
MEKEFIVSRLLYVFLLVLLLLFAFAFISPYLFGVAKAQQTVSNTTEEKEETIENPYRSLEITSADQPEVTVYKLFRNFDPFFLNETSGDKIVYNSFTLDLKVKTYDIAYGNLTNMTKEGIRNFSEFDNYYQVGDSSQQSTLCDNPAAYRADIDYAIDCWSTAIENNELGSGDPCKIFVHGNLANNFDEEVKIRVGWHKRGFVAGKQIIGVVVTICDYNLMMA